MARVLTLAALLLGASLVSAQPLPPELTAPVNDFAGVIDSANEARLETLIRSLESASGDVIVVATVRTFRPYADLPSYAVKMFENHGRGIGARSQDAGALIVLAVDDRQVRIEVGYGLEGIITDGFSGEISRDVMVPYFRRGEYGEGLIAGATRVAQRIAEARNVTLDVQPPPVRRPQRSVGLGFNPITVHHRALHPVSPAPRRRAARRTAARTPRPVVERRRALRCWRRLGIGRQLGRVVRRIWRRVRGRFRRIRRRSVWRRRRWGLMVERKRMQKLMRFLGILAVAAAALGSSGCSYNTFVSQEEAIKTQWAQVENQLQRRNDLIPNLVETAKGFAQQERDVFGAIAESRAKLAGAQTPEQRMAAANEQSNALARLLVVVENYPDLKSNQTFARLMDELAGTENRLAVERMRYNEAVQAYNTQRRSFPANITAGIFGFKEYQLFQAPESAKQVPKVDFTRP